MPVGMVRDLPTTDRMLEESWRARTRRLPSREVVTETTGLVLFLAAAIALLVLAPAGRDAPAALVAALTLAYALTSHVRFPVGFVSIVPSHLVLFPLLFALPPALVPLCAFTGMVLSSSVDALRGVPPRWRVLMCGNDAWHVLGGAAVLVLAGQPSIGEVTAAQLGLAFAAVLALDWVSGLAREWIASGVSPREKFGIMVQASALDLSLAPVGLAAAHAGRLGALYAVPLAGLLALLARDRSGRIEQAHERLEALRHEQGRLRAAVRRTGEALAARHDFYAVVEATLDTAMHAVEGSAGRVWLTPGVAPREAIALGDPHAEPAMRAAAAVAEVAGPPVVASVAGIHALACREQDGVLVVARGLPFTGEERELFAYVIAQGTAAAKLALLHERFRRQALTDDLTGLANHRRLQEALDTRIANGAPLSLVLLDVDDFKAVNDRHGHGTGDEVLRAVGAALDRVAAAAGALAARYGGEEFAIVVDGDVHAARGVAQEACASIRSLGLPIRVTASCGVASAREKDALFGAADRALYAAKHAGKDRVEVAPALRAVA